MNFAKPLSEAQGASAELIRISVAGLAFKANPAPELQPGEVVNGVLVRVGDCRINGDLVVRSIEPANALDLEVGCLFYPAGDRNAERLMALLAGIDAAKADL